MTTTPQKTKERASRNRRTHNSFDHVPLELRKTLTRMVIDNEWPDDFKNHYNGVPRYVDMVQYCKTKGHNISHSVIGRYAKRIQTLADEKTGRTQERVKLEPYVLLYLSTVSKKIQETGSEILELESQWDTSVLGQASRQDHRYTRLHKLRSRLMGLNRYYAKILTTLNKVEA